MISPTAQPGIEFGGGALVGGLIGFAAKKLMKLVALLVGVQLVVLSGLASADLIQVDWHSIETGLRDLHVGVSQMTGVTPAPTTIGAGVTVGLLAGLKVG